MEGKSDLADVMRQGQGKGNGSAAEVEQDEEAISFGKLNDQNFPRASNKPIPRLHVRLKDGGVHSFMYHQLDSHATLVGNEITLLFAGAKHWQVKLKGRGDKFWKCYDYICLHRWPFIVEATRDFAGDSPTDAVFTSIEIKDVTPKMSG